VQCRHPLAPLHSRSVPSVSDLRFKYFIYMLQKSIWDVAYVAMVIYVCYKSMSQVFQVFQKYVSSVSSRSCICCYSCTRMFRAYVSSICFERFMLFKRMLQVFHLIVVKEYLNVTYVAIIIHTCFKRMF
jgi:hypothetical protein